MQIVFSALVAAANAGIIAAPYAGAYAGLPYAGYAGAYTAPMTHWGLPAGSYKAGNSKINPGRVAGPIAPAHGDFVATPKGARPLSLEGFSEDINQDGFVDPIGKVVAYAAPAIGATPAVTYAASPAIAAAPAVAAAPTVTYATAPGIAAAPVAAAGVY